MSALETPYCSDFLGYFPILHGLSPSNIGLKRLNSNFSSPNNKIFQFGRDWQECLENKKQCRIESFNKYYQKKEASDDEICLWMAKQLSLESPDLFQLKQTSETDFELDCLLTHDRICVKNGTLCLQSSKITSFCDPVDLFDALAMQVPEDLVVQSCSKNFEENHCSRIHLCHANGWSAEWAINKSFDEIHARVPNIHAIIKDSSKILSAIVRSPQTLERIGATNFRTSRKLNRHPSIPESLRHIPFDHKTNQSLFLRFERQCTIGFSNTNQFLFTIRTYMTQISPAMPQEKWEAFLNLIQKPSDGTNSDKFLKNNRDEILLWISDLGLKKTV